MMAMGDDILYFGYGSNLHLDDLHAFCADRGLGTGFLEVVGTAFLPDRELAFTRLSQVRGGGVLDVRPRQGQLVDGMLFRVRDSAGWDALDAKEGARQGAYRHLDTVALRLDGSAVRVRTYEVAEPVPFVRPDPRYLEIALRAREELGLETEAVERAARDERPAPQRSLFVYGSLLRGEERHGQVRVAGLRSVLLAECRGALADLGAQPGLRLGGDARVRGELLTFSDAEAVLTELDRAEGFEGFGSGAPGPFERRYVEVGLGGRVRHAWVYVSSEEACAGGGAIAGGCWRTHRGVSEAVHAAIAAGHGDERALVEALAERGPFPVRDREAFLRERTPLARALATGRVSERELAQVSGRWTVPV